MHVSRDEPAPLKELLHEPSEQARHRSESAAEHARFVFTKRALHQSPDYFKALAFLSPLVQLGEFPRTIQAAREDFLKITEVMTQEALANPALKEGFDTVGEWVARPIRPEFLALYDRVRRPNSSPLKTYLATVHLRALRTILSHTCGPEVIRGEAAVLISDLTNLKANVMRRLERCGEHFVGNLILEAETRAADSPAFERALSFAALSFARCRAPVAALLPAAKGTPVGDEFPEAYADKSGLSFRGDCTHDWWCIPAHVGLILILVQDENFA
jgi:hypothetical protein